MTITVTVKFRHQNDLEKRYRRYTNTQTLGESPLFWDPSTSRLPTYVDFSTLILRPLISFFAPAITTTDTKSMPHRKRQCGAYSNKYLDYIQITVHYFS